jgi:hypothetical protein
MGIIIPDVYTFANGIELSNVYISFFQEQLFIQPNNFPDGKKFIISTSYRIYKDKSAREEVKDVIEKGSIMNTVFTLSDVYNDLYTALKLKFPNCIDDM